MDARAWFFIQNFSSKGQIDKKKPELEFQLEQVKFDLQQVFIMRPLSVSG